MSRFQGVTSWEEGRLPPSPYTHRAKSKWGGGEKRPSARHFIGASNTRTPAQASTGASEDPPVRLPGGHFKVLGTVGPSGQRSPPPCEPLRDAAGVATENDLPRKGLLLSSSPHFDGGGGDEPPPPQLQGASPTAFQRGGPAPCARPRSRSRGGGRAWAREGAPPAGGGARSRAAPALRDLRKRLGPPLPSSSPPPACSACSRPPCRSRARATSARPRGDGGEIDGADGKAEAPPRLRTACRGGRSRGREEARVRRRGSDWRASAQARGPSRLFAASPSSPPTRLTSSPQKTFRASYPRHCTRAASSCVSSQ